MPASLISASLADEDPDVLVGRALVEAWVGRGFADEEDYHRGRKRFYAAANAGQVPAVKVPGIGWVARRSTISQHRRQMLDAADAVARERVGMAPRAA
jgi:hypothetical protein